MLIKAILNSLEEAPQPLRLFYAKTDDGKFALELDGEHPDSTKLAEFRANNRALVARLKKLDGLDPEEHAALKASAAEHDAKLVAAETARAAAVADVEKLKADLAKFEGVDPVEYQTLKSSDAAGKLTQVEQQLRDEKAARAVDAFDHRVGWSFLKQGGRPECLDFVKVEARKTFTPTPTGLETTAVSAVDPGRPLTIDEWVGQQYQAAAFAFLPSRGGGASPSPGGARPADTRPVIDRHDADAFGQNIAGIAAGKVIVR